MLNLGPDASGSAAQIDKEMLRGPQEHGILVVRGQAEYTPIASKLDDAQFVQQRDLTAREIARCFRIPAHMISTPSADSMTYSNVEQESIEFVRYSLAPWLRRIELAISNDSDLAFQRQFVKFEIDGLLRADSAGRAAFYTAALNPQTGWMSRNEVRELEDLEPEAEDQTAPLTSPLTMPAAASPIIMQPPAGAANGNGN